MGEGDQSVLSEVFEDAAGYALAAWYPASRPSQEQELPDLVQELWLWYLTRKETRAKMEKLSKEECVETAKIHAFQLLSEQALQGNTFRGKDTYGTDAVKDVLAGKSTNRFLYSALPTAMEALDHRNPGQAEAIRSRYDDGLVPQVEGGAAMLLSRAVHSLTAEINMLVLTSKKDEGIGSRAVFASLDQLSDPRHRKGKGVHGDPTANTAIMLMENPELRDEYLQETSFSELLGGRS
jgi:hypothetical protein